MKKNELEKLPVVDEKCEMPSEGTYTQQEDMIKAYIFEVRGKQVILDFHLAKLYAVENRTLKRQYVETKTVFRMILCLDLQKIKLII